MSKNKAGHSQKNSAFKIVSSEDDVVTISIEPSPHKALGFATFKLGDDVIVTTSKKTTSAFRKSRCVSEVVAYGVVCEVENGRIKVDSNRSPIVSVEAQHKAVANRTPVKVKVLD